MVWYDWLMIAVLGYCMVRGAAKGFVWQLAGITALVLCFVFAKTGSTTIAPVLPIDPPLNRWVAMAILYVALAFACFFVAGRMKDAMERAKLQEFDHHLGGIFGLLKGAVFCLILTFFGVTLSADLRADILKSRSGHWAAVTLKHLGPVMPDELANVLEPHFDPLHAPDPEAENNGDVVKPDEPKFDPFESLKPNTPLGLPKTGSKDPQKPTVDPFTGVDPFLSNWFGKEKEKEKAAVPSGVEKIINEIAALHSDDASAQKKIAADIGQRMSGLPDRVAKAALEDWKADLNNDADPDKATRFDTDLATRIRRQLRAAGVSVDSLAKEVRDRLN